MIQIGPNKCTKINEIAKIIIKNLGKEIIIKHDLNKPIGDIGRRANYEKAEKLLGWEPNISIEDGLKI